ncbi:hypothetical protein ACFWBR_25005 [Streptomyces sp. NPDC060006]|uniref:hypothetical protein n=1 Tax=unclassified Streptomyces TaxID=2593676 RepID=UPI0036A06A9D
MYTIRENGYDGLRFTEIHPDNGDMNSVVFPFEEHGTFLLDLRGHNHQPPWSGADVGGLRSAIE